VRQAVEHVGERSRAVERPDAPVGCGVRLPENAGAARLEPVEAIGSAAVTNVRPCRP